MKEILRTISDVHFSAGPGFCQCGCGLRTGKTRGRFNRFLKEHSWKARKVHRGGLRPAEERTGYCECGCGQKTTIARYTIIRDQMFKGFPNRFIQAHGSRNARRPNKKAVSISAKRRKADGGLCACGCRRPAPIATYNRPSDDIFIGYPVKFIKGHGRSDFDLSEARRILSTLRHAFKTDNPVTFLTRRQHGNANRADN